MKSLLALATLCLVAAPFAIIGQSEEQAAAPTANYKTTYDSTEGVLHVTTYPNTFDPVSLKSTCDIFVRNVTTKTNTASQNYSPTDDLYFSIVGAQSDDYEIVYHDFPEIEGIVSVD